LDGGRDDGLLDREFLVDRNLSLGLLLTEALKLDFLSIGVLEDRALI